MIAILAAGLAYALPVGVCHTYDLEIVLDGHAPLLGRPTNRIELQLEMKVTGTKAPDAGSLAATVELTAMKSRLNGVSLPFTIEDVRASLPTTNIVFSSLGKVLKNDAPDVVLPVHLPGVDPKRLPDVSFLPVEFPASPVEVGQSWEFVRRFGGADVRYSATATELGPNRAVFDAKVSQNEITFEDANGELVKEESQASFKVETVLQGTGKVVFDVKRGLATSFEANLSAVGKAAPVGGGAPKERRLKTTIRAKLRP
jgi:hypothetical protein